MERDADGVPLDPPEPSAEEVEARRRWLEQASAVYELPTEPYLGLTLNEATSLAQQQGRVLRVLGEGMARRMDLQSNRVNVVLDQDGRVKDVKGG